VCVRASVAACLGGLSSIHDEEPSPLSIFIHADDVVRRRGFASRENAQSWFTLNIWCDVFAHNCQFAMKFNASITVIMNKLTYAVFHKVV